MAKASMMKGVYNMNPTQMIMKQGSAQAHREMTREPGTRRDNSDTAARGNRATPADTACTKCDDMTHPMMQTRHSHPKNQRYADGRDHEDAHHAVKKSKGMM